MPGLLPAWVSGICKASVHHLVAVIILRRAVYLLGLWLGLHVLVALHELLLLIKVVGLPVYR